MDLPDSLRPLDRPAARRTGAVAPLSWWRSLNPRKATRLLVIYALGLVIVATTMIPVLWMVKTSFETPEFLHDLRIQFWPLKFTWQNYLAVLNNPNTLILRSTYNSLSVAFLATVLNLAITASAGYAMSRFEFRGKAVFGMYLLLFYMIPRTLMLIGMFVLLAKLHLINRHLGLVITYAIGGIPLAIWWLKGYFDAIPVEIEEQAMIDGCSRLGALWRVIVPLALPGVAAVGMIQFVDSWNEFQLALTIIQTDTLQLLPVRIVYFMGFQRTDWGPTMAFSVLVAIPAIILFGIAQRNMISGLMSGFSK
ncbi:MAG TPA: carbohydrate ABC transporter permease [Anaerolineales bacterium]|nr:carbohydrate ABC transporter permease [Anaerolineales bacterium]